PHLDLAFHGVISPVSVRIAGLSGFYGILMPRQIAYEEAIPAWLQPPQPPAVEESRIIRLHAVEGEAKLAGVDEDGLHWVQFEVDEFAGQEPGTCAICGETLTSGWLCGDGGEEVCDRHVETLEQLTPSSTEEPVAIPA
ncbi:MAG: hypothetical protein ACYDBB_26910, partial [Armatimonadota bacterium]